MPGVFWLGCGHVTDATGGWVPEGKGRLAAASTAKRYQGPVFRSDNGACVSSGVNGELLELDQ
jgi:hypothetical protein